jgi:hypothetical protein
MGEYQTVEEAWEDSLTDTEARRVRRVYRYGPPDPAPEPPRE